MMISSGGISSGMNAMCTGMRFWLMIDMARMPRSSPAVVQRVTFCDAVRSSASSLPISQLASSCGSPECATAIAKAPSRA